jgi:hypothetical protein
VLHRFGGMAVWRPRWYILAVPTEAFTGAACLAISRIILWPSQFQLPNAVEVFRLKLYLSDVEGTAIGGPATQARGLGLGVGAREASTLLASGRGCDCRLDDPHDGRHDRAIEDQTENGDPQVWVRFLCLEVARQVARQRWEDAKQDRKQR